MKRFEVIERLIALTNPEEDAVVFANGRIVREALYLGDRSNHFYMLASMGHAPMIALGIAMAQPQRRVIVIDGDGNLLMNPGGLVSIASMAPQSFIHVVLDNAVYGTTGGQRCLSATTDLAALAKASGYATAITVDTHLEDVSEAFQQMYGQPGAHGLVVKVDPDDLADCPVFNLPPETIKTRFRTFLAADLL